jgi:hypothetical protein
MARKLDPTAEGHRIPGLYERLRDKELAAAGKPDPASAFIVFAAPAGADTSEQDYRFLTTLESIGMRITNTALVTQHAHMVCNEGLAHGVSWQEIQAQLIDWGQKPRDADLFIYNAIDVYCPQYAAMTTDQITDDLRRH